MLSVHIGNRKSGSTTIQSFAFNNSALLARLGVIYPDIGLRKHQHRRLAEATWDDKSDDHCLRSLEHELRQNPERRYLISAEGLFAIKPRAIRRLLEYSGGHDLKVIAYIREYPEWIVSLYGHYAIVGYTTKHFDAFFDEAMQEASALPALQRWAEAVGPENVRIRSTNPASLSGGTLIADLFDALQIEASEDAHSLAWPRTNVTPSWPIVELHRALRELRLVGVGGAFDYRLKRSLARDLEACLARSGWRAPPQRYLTRGQFEAAASLYNRDVRILNETFGSGVPEIVVNGIPERAFLPSFDEVPLHLRRAFTRRLLRRLLWSSVRRRHSREFIAAKWRVWRALSRRYAGRRSYRIAE